MDWVYRGWAGGRGVGWAMGAGGEPKAGPSTHLNRKAAIVCSLKCTDSQSSLVRPTRSLTAVFDTKCSLISAPQWHRTLQSGLSWIYRVTEMMPVKADLAIYSSANGVYGQCRSVAFMSSHNLDFSSCGIVPGFCKSSHILWNNAENVIRFMQQ